jgi:hypothetical protein
MAELSKGKWTTPDGKEYDAKFYGQNVRTGDMQYAVPGHKGPLQGHYKQEHESPARWTKKGG